MSRDPFLLVCLYMNYFRETQRINQIQVELRGLKRERQFC